MDTNYREEKIRVIGETIARFRQLDVEWTQEELARGNDPSQYSPLRVNKMLVTVLTEWERTEKDLLDVLRRLSELPVHSATNGKRRRKLSSPV